MANAQKKITELVSIVQKKPKQGAKQEETQNIMRHNCEFCQTRMKLIAGGEPVGRFIRRVWKCPECETQVTEKIYPGKNVVL